MDLTSTPNDEKPPKMTLNHSRGLPRHTRRTAWQRKQQQQPPASRQSSRAISWSGRPAHAQQPSSNALHGCLQREQRPRPTTELHTNTGKCDGRQWWQQRGAVSWSSCHSPAIAQHRQIIKSRHWRIMQCGSSLRALWRSAEWLANIGKLHRALYATH